MTSWQEKPCFLDCFGLRTDKNKAAGPIVSIIGAGGKSSLLFHLAKKARSIGMRVLVTTTTHMWIPEKEQYDCLDLEGNLFDSEHSLTKPGIYVSGRKSSQDGKMCSANLGALEKSCNNFDVILIEADGAAGKMLKGWSEREPVILPQTSHVIGVVDISSVGTAINSDNIHRVEIFNNIAGVEGDGLVTIEHLLRMINHKDGLFGKSFGNQVLFLNKMESELHFKNASSLRKMLPHVKMVGGSVQQDNVYVSD